MLMLQGEIHGIAGLFRVRQRTSIAAGRYQRRTQTEPDTVNGRWSHITLSGEATFHRFHALGNTARRGPSAAGATW